jgi:hypothetical protein
MPFGALSRRSVHPTSPVLLTKTGPLVPQHLPDGACQTHTGTHTFRVRECAEVIRDPKTPNRSLYRMQLLERGTAILRETSEGTSH